ncbi:unnamed protein product [Urochloa humidicola]
MVFTLRAPRSKSMVPRHDAPSGETDAPRPPPSCPPSSEDFRPISHPACRTILAVARSPSPASPPPEEAWRRPKHHLSATSTHQPALQPHHHGGARPASSTRRWELPPLAVACRGRPRPPMAGGSRPWPAVASSGLAAVGRLWLAEPAVDRPVVAVRGEPWPPWAAAASRTAVVAVPLTRDKHQSN